VEYRLVLPGTASPEVIVDHRFLRIPAVYVGGREVERRFDGGRSYWPIETPGGERRLFLHGSLRGLEGAVDGQRVGIERRLAVWEVVLALLPFALVGLGLPGGLVGVLAAGTNLWLVRRPWRAAGRAAALLGVFVAGLVLTLALLALAGPAGAS
jgi:hypothetical protein